MAKRSKKHAILGGVKVSSKQLSEWGSSGGRPKKYTSNAERQRAYKLRKKQAKFGKKAQLDERKTYGEVKIKRYVVCPQCGSLNNNLSQYFNEKGEYISETWWFDAVRWKKTNIRENVYHCPNCPYTFSFLRGEIKAEETKTIIKKAGSSTERSQRSREKQKQKSKIPDTTFKIKTCSFVGTDIKTKQDFLSDCPKPLFDKKKRLCRSHHRQVWNKFNKYLAENKPSVSETAAWLSIWEDSRDWGYFWDLAEEAEKV